MRDASDHSDEPLPARRSIAPPLAPPHQEYQDDYVDQAHPHHGKKFTSKLLWRAFKRHWWFALPTWLIISGGLMFLAYNKIKPTFDATSAIRVEPANTGIFNGKNDVIRQDFMTYLQTQVSTVTSPNVVELALANDPKLMKLPMLRGSQDPALDIKQSVKVGIVPGTTYIQLELSSQFPDETAQIVNAVVKAYIDHSKSSFDESTSNSIKMYEEMKKTQNDKVKALREGMTSLIAKMGATSTDTSDRNNTTLDSYHRYNEEWVSVRIKLMAAKVKLDQLKNESSAVQGIDPKMIDDEVRDIFYSGQQVARLQQEKDAIDKKIASLGRLARNSNGDPSYQVHSKRLLEITASIADLWKKQEGSIRRRLMAGMGDANTEQMVKGLEVELAGLKAHEAMLDTTLKDLKIIDKDEKGKSLELEFLRGDLAGEEGVLNKIQDQINQLKFEQRNTDVRVSQAFKAAPARRPNADRRNQAIIIAPIATGLVLLLLMMFMEFRGARVNDPEELAHRMNLQVIGVVPPLPQLRLGMSGGSPSSSGGSSIMTSSEMRAQRELDEFVQSLDHLRVALCARKDPWGRDKHCVLITSACGSEGKTTLAAQLAERCVNAGLMTLLIDADLRNPTLSRMLDSVDSPGLINVLRGEMLAEDVVTVIGDAGGFHLLPAGTPKMDPSRLLQGDRLGKLLAQARESFDMIIVDAPPVLPVPDALTIGKWTDGAVLAVRYDTSRFPLVERANRRLAHVGVPVIGAVVNGVRSMESAYGGYYAYGGYGSNAPSGSSSSVSDE